MNIEKILKMDKTLGKSLKDLQRFFKEKVRVLKTQNRMNEKRPAELGLMTVISQSSWGTFDV